LLGTLAKQAIYSLKDTRGIRERCNRGERMRADHGFMNFPSGVGRKCEALAEELLLSIDAREREQIDAAWLQEIRRRDATYSERRGRATPVEDVIARLE
jgi:hypothetical protein